MREHPPDTPAVLRRRTLPDGWVPDPRGGGDSPGQAPPDPGVGRPGADVHPHRGAARAVLECARPRQWTKNLLVFAAPAAAGALHRPEIFAAAAVAVIAFCLAAAGLYLVNDAFDAPADRSDPVKRHRPIARGDLPASAALIAGSISAVGSVVVGAAVSLGLAALVACYVAVGLTYSLHLKHVAVLELCVVAAGFVIRAAAGGIAAGVELSPWFMMVATFGAVAVVAGKRHAELLRGGEGAAVHRGVLATYDQGFTGLVVAAALAAMTVTYCLWAFADPGQGMYRLSSALSVAPFGFAVLRYGLLVHLGQAGEPEEILREDRQLQATGAVWVTLLALGAYGVV